MAAQGGSQIATKEELGFTSRDSWNSFQAFLTNYLAFNSDVMELLLALASLKSFDLESASKLKESSLVRQLDKSVNLLDTQMSREEQGQ